MPEIGCGEGRPRTGPDRADFRSRHVRRANPAQGRGVRRRPARPLAIADEFRPPASIGNQPRWPVSQPPPAPAAIYSNNALRQPNYGAPSTDRFRCPRRASPPRKMKSSCPPGQAGPAGLGAPWYPRGPIRRALLIRIHRLPAACHGSARREAIRCGRGSGIGQADGDVGLSDRVGAGALARQFRAAGGPRAGSARGSSRSSRSPPIPAAA